MRGDAIELPVQKSSDKDLVGSKLLDDTRSPIPNKASDKSSVSSSSGEDGQRSKTGESKRRLYEDDGLPFVIIAPGVENPILGPDPEDHLPGAPPAARRLTPGPFGKRAPKPSAGDNKPTASETGARQAAVEGYE